MREPLALALLVIGCGPIVDAATDTATSQPSADDTSTGAIEVPPGHDDDDSVPLPEPEPEPDQDSTGPTTDDVDDTSDDEDPTSSLFICELDGLPPVNECDIWAQDCPVGQKCMPWANDGGNSWNATRCSPVDPNPAAVGDECTVEESGVSGIDNCELGAMCWNVDPETNIGTCVGFCQGSEANPTCPDPGASCSINADGTLILCIPNCSPLLQDCNEGEACYPTNDAFSCVPDAGGDMGGFGDGCEFLNVCDPGLFCAVPDGVPDCEGSIGCCSSFCNLADAQPSASCPGVAGGQECIAWYEDGQAPSGYEDVGACLIPT